MNNAASFLDQLLRSGADLLQPANASRGEPRSYPEANTGRTHSHDQRTRDLSSLVSGKGGAALIGGALGLLIGSKSGRKIGGKVLTYGGLAALGTLAYQAYQNHQRQLRIPNEGDTQPLDRLPNQATEARCRAILAALIAASKSDGHVDERERQLIDAEIAKLTADQGLREWIDRELQKPLDPAEVASLATNQAMASELYLVSLLAVDQQSFMERSYLQELATQLKLPPTLQSELANQLKQEVTNI